jgi:toxin ParE1/3/4
MARVVYTESADADSASIFRYLTNKAGPRTVVKYRVLLNRLYDRLSDHPDSGAPRPALGQNIRIGVVSPYCAELVTILRIVYGRRRITAKLLSE